VPPAPAAEPAAPAPAAPAPAAAPSFPPIDPANFTAISPTKETVNNFLQLSWGYDDNRIWQVAAIEKTAAEGVSKVIIFVGDKTGKQKPGGIAFFALPDGKHIIAGDEVLPFGDHPYTEYKALAEQRADGPYRGSASKSLEIVEFADFESRIARKRKPTWTNWRWIFPRPALCTRTIRCRSIKRQRARPRTAFA
jgi:hypothetical protein